MNTKEIISVSLIFGLLISLFLQVNTNFHLEEVSKDNLNITKEYDISSLLDGILLKLSSIESAQRGFVITGDKDILQDHEINKAAVRSGINTLKGYLEKHQLHEEGVQISILAKEKIDFCDRTIEVYAAKGTAAAMILIESGRGFRIMENILGLVDKINFRVKNTMERQVKIGQAKVAVVKKWSILGTIVVIIIVLLSILLLYKDIKQRDLLKDKLKESLEESKKNVLIKQQFMANMSHEIRTPMNAILGFVNLLSKTKLNEVQRQHLQVVKSAGNNLMAIINDILDFSKMEAGMLRIEKYPFSVHQLMNSLCTMLREKADEKNIQMSLVIDDKIPSILRGDQMRLSQIMINLMGNAIKFTKEGEILIKVRLKNETTENVLLEFSVRDSGIGIPADQLNSVFENFNQGNTSTTREYGGTGLGLTIVKDLLELQNGEIKVESILGKGATFTFLIPYQKVEFSQPTKEPIQRSEIRMRDTSIYTILVVEDNPMNQKLASLVLSELGFNWSIADNGEIALEMLKNAHFDLVLLDLQMPVMDGYTTVEKIRNVLKLKIPVVAMSAHVMVGEKEKCLSLGMNDYISKPFVELDLLEILTTYLSVEAGVSIGEKESVLLEMKERVSSFCDLSYLLSMANGNLPFLLDLCTIFVIQNPLDLENLEKYFEERDFEGLSITAHKMKSSSRIMGFDQKIEGQLTELDQLEKKRGSIDLLQIRSLIDGIKSACTEAQNEIELLLEDKKIKVK